MDHFMGLFLNEPFMTCSILVLLFVFARPDNNKDSPPGSGFSSRYRGIDYKQALGPFCWEM